MREDVGVVKRCRVDCDMIEGQIEEEMKVE